MPVTHKMGPFRLDAEAGVLYRGDVVTLIGKRGVDLLRAMVSQPGVVIAKQKLIDAAWPGLVMEESNLSVQIASLRQTLAEEPGAESWIETKPRHGYRYVGPVETVTDTSRPSPDPSTKAEGPRALNLPSIVVLPFVNLSGPVERDYLGDAISEDIITALVRFRWFSVVSRDASFACHDDHTDEREIADRFEVRYVLSGSHRWLGERARVTARLFEARTGGHIWSDHYDVTAAELGTIQDDIVERVVGAIEPALLRVESGRGWRGRPGNLSAWDLVRRGMWYFHRVTRENHHLARDLFRRAVEIDELLPEAHIWLARVCGGIALWRWCDDPAAVAHEGQAAVLRAIHLDEQNPYAHYALAISSCPANELEQAIRAAERAIELSPSFGLGHLVLGMGRLYAGQAKAAEMALRRGLLLNHHDPHNFVWFDLLALACLFGGDTEAAIAAATRALTIRPAWRLTLEIMALCHAAANQYIDACRFAAAMRETTEHPTDILSAMRQRNPAWHAAMEEWLRQASADPRRDHPTTTAPEVPRTR